MKPFRTLRAVTLFVLALTLFHADLAEDAVPAFWKREKDILKHIKENGVTHLHKNTKVLEIQHEKYKLD